MYLFHQEQPGHTVLTALVVHLSDFLGQWLFENNTTNAIVVVSFVVLLVFFGKCFDTASKNLAARDVGRQLLDGDGFARVQQVVHLSKGLLAVVVQCLVCYSCCVVGSIRTAVLIRILRVLVTRLVLWPPGLVEVILFELVQDADRTVLTDTVAHLLQFWQS